MAAQELLAELPSVASSNGVLETSIHLRAATHTVGDWNLTTRTLNGTVPGPTLLVQPGDVLLIHFYNDLAVDLDSRPYRHNEFSAPEESNLHFHGLHVSGELPSDDVTLVVKPGERYTYNTTIPEVHMPGTHWIHPHRHGSSALQVGGGAASVIVVQDTDEIKAQLPTAVANSREIILMIQEINLGELQAVSDTSRANLPQTTGTAPSNAFHLVNGQFNPVLPIRAGEWNRLRVIYAGWLKGALSLSIPGCEMQLIAKDGIYLRDLPRSIQRATLVNAGRADVMVRCPDPDAIYTLGRSHEPILTLRTSEDTALESENIVSKGDIFYPDYLADLRETPPSEGCACSTSTKALNYVADKVLHTSFQGAVVERRINTGNHPYHQHVHPFQIISGFQSDDGYYQVGDWHDTIQSSGVVRYQPGYFTGKVMLHCHRLKHEDNGMMDMEYIQSGTGGNCTCGIQPSSGRGNDDFPVLGVALGSVAAALAAFSFVIYCRRRKRPRASVQ